MMFKDQELKVPHEILFLFFRIRQLGDIAEFAAQLENVQTVLAWMGRRSAR